MLGEGLRSGFNHMGIQTRPVCYVEREAYPASVLVSRMQEGSIHQAPIWSDVTTFDSKQFAGAVDCIVAGFPCQDLSIAGRRAGLDGKRSGLFFEVVRIARDCGARYLFLENVSGIASATATVVDDEEGELDERAASRVLGELADNGWNAEWITLSASDVGASHKRARWFCWAWRDDVDNTGCVQRGAGHEQNRPGCTEAGEHEAHNRAANGSAELGHTTGTRPQKPRQTGERELPAQAGTGLHHRPEQPGGEVGQPESVGRPTRWAEHAWQQGGAPTTVSGAPLGHTGLQHQHVQQWEDGAEHQGAGGGLANASCTGCEGVKQRGALHGNRYWAQTHGSTEQLCRPLFAPGPSEPAWPGIIQHSPHLAPALEPSFHRVFDGMEHRMDDCRPQRLKCCGNGVVAAQAAAALVILVQRMMQ